MSDTYNRTPTACRFCANTTAPHGVNFACISRDRRGEPPQDWLILARMKLRRGDRYRWLSGRDYYTTRYYRKWLTGRDPE